MWPPTCHNLSPEPEGLSHYLPLVLVALKNDVQFSVTSFHLVNEAQFMFYPLP